MTDLAAFNEKHVRAVHGDYPRCLVSGLSSNIELHHILGRGGKHDRKLCSSVLNCAPLWNTIHAMGDINDEYFAQFLLGKILRKVQSAVISGRYTYTKNDYAFMEAFHTTTKPLL